jgi:AcrR family transcriptional regulator
MLGAARPEAMEDKGPAASNGTSADAPARRHADRRRATLEAMLETSGELGYRGATVRRVLARSGGTVVQFYRQFRSRRECFAAAYELELDRLCAALLEVGASKPSWSEGFAAALAELLDYVSARPPLARTIFEEVYVAGGAALVRHEEVLERLSGAIDSAHRKTTGSCHSPPPVTANFIVGGIEGLVRAKLAAGEAEQLPQTLPELMRIVTALYRDGEAAGGEAKQQ